MGLLLGFPVSDRTAESTLTCRKAFVKLDNPLKFIISSGSSSNLLKDHDSVDTIFVHLMQKTIEDLNTKEVCACTCYNLVCL